MGSTNPDVSGNWSVQVQGLVGGDEVTATAIDKNGNTSEFALNTSTTANIEDIYLNNFKIILYPNPATNSAFISYNLPDKTHMEITIWDYTGNEVEKVYNGFQNKGEQNIELFLKDKLFSDGIYFVTINANYEYHAVLKLNILK